MDRVQQEFQDVMRDVFDDDEIAVTPDMTAADVEGWDSLMHVNLIIAVEKHFGIKFATAEISGLKADDQSVATFLDLVRSKL